jgi:Flp pilus assembly protein TadD
MMMACKRIMLLSVFVLTACASQPQLDGREGQDFTIDELKKNAEMSSYAGAYRDALMQYQKILEKAPDNVDALIGVGEALLAEGQYVRAENYFERALAFQPQNPQAREARALSWLLSGKYADAQKSLLNMVDDGIDRWRMWDSLGIIADVFGDYSLAVSYYNKALAISPDHAMLLNNLGYSMMMAHEYVAAENTFKKSLVLEPGNVRAVNNLSISIAWQGRYDEAVEHLRTVMDEAASYNNVGYVAYLSGDYELAEDYFIKAMRLRPTYYKRAASNLDLTLQKKNKAGSLKE